MFDAIKGAAPGGKAGSTGSALSRQEIDAFFDLSKQADNLLQRSVNSLSRILLNKDEIDRLDRQRQEVEGIKDPKEREAAVTKVNEDRRATVAKAAESKEAQEKVGKLDDKQKKLAVDSIYNLILSGLKNKACVQLASGISQKAQANPMSAANYSTELPRIKDAAVLLPDKAEKTFALGNNLVKLAKSGNIEPVLPKSDLEPAKEVATF
jgi:vacuolar-type H+-ATPase subunit I/STV1